jgi:hypothetical protein
MIFTTLRETWDETASTSLSKIYTSMTGKMLERGKTYTSREIILDPIFLAIHYTSRFQLWWAVAYWIPHECKVDENGMVSVTYKTNQITSSVRE